LPWLQHMQRVPKAPLTKREESKKICEYVSVNA
jgi:hypothetical protein